VKLSAVCTNEGRLFQTVGAQHENRRAAMFVKEDCVDSRSDVDDSPAVSGNCWSTATMFGRKV